MSQTHFGFETVDEREKAGRVRGVFDSVATRYDLMNDLLSFGLHRLWKTYAVAVANLRPGDKVLDIAGGTGDLARAFASKVGTQGLVVLTDINEAMLRVGRDRLLDRGVVVPTLTCDAEHLPFADASFDLAIAWDVVEHVQDPERLLAELARVLRPGGRALLTVINRFAYRDPHYHLPLLNWMPRPLAEAIIARRGRSKGQSDFSDRQKLSEMHYYTMPGFRRLAAGYGFRVGDLREDRVRRGEGSATGLKGRARDALRRLGLARAAYLAYRTAIQGTYELLLVKVGETE